MKRPPFTPANAQELTGGGGRVMPAGGAALFVALLVFLSAGYFQNSRPGWNVNSQFALTCAIVEHHTLSIDAYHELPELETGDKAYYEGRFYSDKSPVTAFLGVPAFAAYRTLTRSAGVELDYTHARYWTTWWTIGLSAAVLSLLTAALLKRLEVREEHAAILAGLWVMATPLLGFSILFYNYAPAAAMALGGYLLVQPTLDGTAGGEETDPWASPVRFLLGGILLGLASWTLQTFALLALLLSAGLAWSAFHSRNAGPGSRILAAGGWIIGGLLGAAGYVVYSYAIFGEITSPYRYEFNETFRDQMSQGLMGAGLPDLKVLQLTTFHPFQGLFFLFPVTAAAVLGAIGLLGVRRFRASAAIALLFLAGLLLYNAGYYMWWGGWSYAPRHLVPALPLLGLGLAPWVTSPDGRLRPVSFSLILLIAIAGATTNIAAVSLDPQPPPGLEEAELMSPESVEAWPSPMLEMVKYVRSGQTDANWGTALGLKGIPSLLPLAGAWFVSVLALLLLRGVSWWAVTALAAAMAFGVALRVPHLESVPPGLWFDEALNAQDALTAAITGHFRLVYTDVFPREPMFITLLAFMMKAGGTSLEALRMVSICIGLLTVAALYPAMRAANERGLALAAPAALAVLRWHAVMSRLLFRTLLLPLWITLLVWTAFGVRKNPTWTRMIILGLLMGGGFYTYLAWYFMFPGVAMLGLWAIWPSLRIPSHRARAFLAVFVAVLTVAPLGIDYIRHPDHIASRPKAVSLGGDEAGGRSVISEIVKNAKDAAGMFHIRGDHVPTVNLPEAPALDPVLGVLFAIGLLTALWGVYRRRPLDVIALGWLALGIAPTIFTRTDSPNFLRTLVATPAVAILIAMGLIRPGQWLWSRARLPILRPALLALAVALLLTSGTISSRDIYLRWARDERVWQASNAFEAQIGRAAAAAPPEVSVWLPDSIRNHRTVRFLTSDLNAIHSYRDFAFLRPAAGASGTRWVFVTFHNQLYPVLQELVPEGRYIHQFPWPGGGATGLIYEIPAGSLPPASEVNRAEARHPIDDISF